MTEKSTPLRSEDVRQKNEKLILHYIQHSHGISQSEIVHLTGLKAPTVLRIFSILEKNGLIKVNKNRPEKDEGDRKGRKPVFYTVNGRAKYVIGVEFWSQTAHVLVVDFARKPVYSLDICLRDGADADEIFEQLSA
ncbi:MAG: winged helix-turn-helix domain-containing protein, partial [Spirochaetota bacterium]